jgi:hypothetical protein
VPSRTPESGCVVVPGKLYSRMLSVKRELPPLPTDQGEPGCRSELKKTVDCEKMRETRECERWKAQYSVGPTDPLTLGSSRI